MQIEKGAEPPPAPPDVAKPPADAKKTAKGVFYKVLKAGKGGPKPTPTDTVRVNYTGWTTDGKMFDSSVIRNEPAEFCAAGRDRGLDRRHHADVGRRQVPVLDSRGARVQGRSPAGRRACSCSTSSCSRSSRTARRIIRRTDMTAEPAADAVAPAWGWRADQLEPLAGGLINTTFVVRDARRADRGAAAAASDLRRRRSTSTSRRSPTHLARAGSMTPRLIRTLDGRAWVEHDGRVWRALTWVDGETVHACPIRAWAEAGGALVGRFHRAVADLVVRRTTSRAPACTTPRRTSRKLRAHVDGGGDAEAAELGREILGAAARCRRCPSSRGATSMAISRSRICCSAAIRCARSPRRSRHARAWARWRSSSATRCARGATRTARMPASVAVRAADLRRGDRRRFAREADALVTRRRARRRSSSGSRPCASSSRRGSPSMSSRIATSAGTRRGSRRGARTTSSARAASSRSACRSRQLARTHSTSCSPAADRGYLPPGNQKL